MKPLELKIRAEQHQSEHTLPVEEQSLMESARKASETAYAPYSDFHVGAAILLEDGSVVTGSNQENASYPSGLCAERVAIFHLGTLVDAPKAVAIAIAARSGKEKSTFGAVTPCGGCRQVMLEHEQRQDKDIAVIMPGSQGSVIRINAARDLLPFQFDSKSLDDKS